MPKVKGCITHDVEFKVSPWRAKKKCRVPDSALYTFSGHFRTSERQPEQGAANLSAAKIIANGEIDGTPVRSSSEQVAGSHPLCSSTVSGDFSKQQPGAWKLRHSPSDGISHAANGINEARCTEEPMVEVQEGEPASASAGSRQHSAGGNASQRDQCAAPAVTSARGGEPSAEVGPLSAGGSAAENRSEDAASICGTGYLIWLPDGRLSGHLISRGDPLGVMGREVLSERECTRDAEWKLLHLTLLNLTHKAEVSCLAEKTGEDSARLKAPFDLHGSEEGTIGNSGPPIDESLQLQFVCETILAESAAEQHLGRFSPSLRDRGAIVNVGPFTCGGVALTKLLAAPDTEQLLYDEDLDR